MVTYDDRGRLCVALDGGETMNEPGIYANIPMQEYQRSHGISQSSLMLLRDKSPAHLKWAMEHPTDPTPAMLAGSAIHDAVLLPDMFHKYWVPLPDLNIRTKEGKEAFLQYQEKHPYATILKQAEYNRVLAVRDAIHNHKYAKQLLVGDAEQSAWWTDEDTGVLCKGRFDLIGKRTGTLVDLKSTRDASPASFTRSIYNFGYYIQAAHYVNGAMTLGVDVEHYAIIAVEKEPPYGVAIYRIRDDAIIAGQDELKPLLEQYAECKETGEWPCYPMEVQDISLPPYAWRQIDEKLGVFV